MNHFRLRERYHVQDVFHVSKQESGRDTACSMLIFSQDSHSVLAYFICKSHCSLVVRFLVGMRCSFFAFLGFCLPVFWEYVEVGSPCYCARTIVLLIRVLPLSIVCSLFSSFLSLCRSESWHYSFFVLDG